LVTPENVLEGLDSLLATKGAAGLMAGTRHAIQDPGQIGSDYQARLQSPLSGSECRGMNGE